MNLNGQKFDAGKTEWDLLPLGPVEEVVKVLMHGREKYGRDNWQLVDNPIRRYYAAAQRHLAAFRRARFDTKDPYDAIDAESHLHHLAHAACCVLFLLWHERKELRQEDAARTEATTREPLWGDSMAGKTKKQQEKLNASLRAEVEAYYSAEPVLIREITDEIKFATYDPDALDKLTARDVQEIESKAFGVVDKGKDSFKVKGIKFWRIV